MEESSARKFNLIPPFASAGDKTQYFGDPRVTEL